MKSCALVLATALLLAACSAPPPVRTAGDFQPIASTFDADIEGWTSDELNAPVWAEPGHLLVVDADNDWNYVIAPAKFRADWTGAASLSLRVLADPAPVAYPVRVMIRGPQHTLVREFDITELEAGAWTKLDAPLVAGDWRHFGGEASQGPVATQAELADTLADVRDLRVRLDLTPKSAADEFNGLDDVTVE